MKLPKAKFRGAVRLLALLCACLLLCTAVPVPVRAVDTKTVRVGYMLHPGYQEGGPRNM